MLRTLVRGPFALLGALVVLAAAAPWARAQDTLWKTSDDAGVKALEAGRYAEAEKHFAAALKIAEESPDQPARLATSLNNLAALYKAQGDYAKAEPLHKRSLAIRQKALGPDHPSVATSLNNLAELYRTQGDYAKAEPLYNRSLVILEKALGPDHPNVAASLENLAGLYRATKRGAQAEALERRAARIRAIKR